MKNNTFKRVLAGSLALLTVAAPMSANVGGILQEVAIVASAKTGDKLSLTWASGATSVQKYLTNITVGSTVYSASDIEKAVGGFNIEAAQGSDAKIVSTVPLNSSFGFNGPTQTIEAYYAANSTDTDYYVNGSPAANFAAVKSNADAYKKLIANWRNAIKTGSYYNVTDLVNSDDSYKLQPGDVVVTEKNNTWTYEFVVPVDEASSNAVSLALVGDTQSVGFKYTKDSKVTANTFSASVENGENDVTVTQADTTEVNGSDFIINGTFKVTSSQNFTVETNDGKESNNTMDFDAVYNASNNVYEADVTIPKYAGTSSGKTVVTIKHLPEETLKYTVEGNKLVVNGATVAENTVAASIKASAKRAEVKDENDKVTEEEVDIKDLTTTNGHVTYGKNPTDGVTVKLERNGKLTTYYGDQSASVANPKFVELTIKKDDAIYGKYEKVGYTFDDSAYAVIGDVDNVTADIFTSGMFFNEAGKYAINATFYTKRDDGGSDVQNVTYNFEIDPIKLTGDDATISVVGNEGTKLTEKAIAFTAGETMELEVPYEKAGTETFTATVDLAEKLKTQDHFTAWTGNEAPKDLTEGTKKYAVEGQTTATALNKVNTVTIKIYDQNYGATLITKGTDTYVKPYEIKVTYKLVAAAQEPIIEPVDDAEDWDKNNEVLVVAQEDTNAAAFEELFWNNFKGNDFVEANKEKITFEYLPAKGKKVTADDLNTRYAGFPTKKNDDGYTLFICYNGEAFDSRDVEIVSVKAKFVPDKAALAMTYGDKINLDSYTLQDANGNKLSNIKLADVEIESIALAEDKDYSSDAGKKNGVQPYLDPDGKYAKGSTVYNNNSDASVEDVTLNAGTYIVKYAPKREVGGDYAVSSDEFVLTVAKKQITADMFYIDAQTYDGKTKTINMDTNCHFRFETATGKKIDGTLGNLKGAALGTYGDSKQFTGYTVTDGQRSAVEAGKYNVSIKLDDNSKTNWKADYNNFTGTADLTWSVTPSVAQGVNPNFTWAADDTTLFDAGRIHVQYSKKANNKLGLDSKVTVTQYGVIVDNKGLIAAPDSVEGVQLGENWYENGKTGANGSTYYGTATYNDAKAKLKFGNGLIEGKASEANQKLNIYGANIKVKDVETGIWARPYMLFSDGTVSYGEPVYVDITREAMKNLQVAFNPEKKLDKTKTNAGYNADINRYVAYAKYEKLDATKVQAVVRDFGVVVDNKGAFGTDGVSVENKNKNVVDDMKLDGNFIIGHNNKAANAVLAQEEYGAKIKPSNSVNGVWVRAYVKLSDTLVVYSKPEYFESVSQYYAGGPIVGAVTNTAKGVTLDDLNETALDAGKTNDTAHNARVAIAAMSYNDTWTNTTVQATPILYKPASGAVGAANGLGITYDNTNRLYTVTFKNTVLKSNKNYEFVAMGVVVDKDEKLVKRETVGTETQFKLVDGAEKQLILGNGFIDGEKTDGTKQTYTARIEPNGNKIIAVRPYVTFKKDGNEVTVYGDIVMNNCGNAAIEYNPQA